MALKWSFSGDRCFRHCQRQYFFREIAASHSSRDPLRREAFIRKQAKSLELWRGLVVHQTIEAEIVPRLLRKAAIPWARVLQAAESLALQQFAFSETSRYREEGLTKTSAGASYCVLLPHLRGEQIANDRLHAVLGEIRLALGNLSGLDELWGRIASLRSCQAEVRLPVEYSGARIEARLDLLGFREFGRPTVVEWKTYSDDTHGDAKLQTTLYAWALHRSEKWAIGAPEDVELLEVQLLSGELREHRCDQRAFDDLEDRIYRSVAEVRALVGDSKFDLQDPDDLAFAESPFSCANCAFRDLCLAPPANRDLAAEVVPIQASLF